MLDYPSHKSLTCVPFFDTNWFHSLGEVSVQTDKLNLLDPVHTRARLFYPSFRYQVLLTQSLTNTFFQMQMSFIRSVGSLRVEGNTGLRTIRQGLVYSIVFVFDMKTAHLINYYCCFVVVVTAQDV